MLLIDNTNTAPFFNAALEEYLLKSSTLEFFMLYRNEPCIVVGKHQNTLAEINYRYVNENNLPVIRRISGGGTVYHDLGNLNFAFITNGQEGKQINFKHYLQPIIDVLNDNKFAVAFIGKNDLCSDHYKISGNAGHVWKNRVLHHGTLLVNANLEKLSESLKPSTGHYKDKAVQSIRSQIANLSALARETISIDSLKKLLFVKISELYPGSSWHIMDKKDISAIKSLVNTRFQTWEWNFGYSPVYQFSNSILSDDNRINILLEINKGYIEQGSITINNEIIQLSKNSENIRHTLEDVSYWLVQTGIQKKINLPLNEIVWWFF